MWDRDDWITFCLITGIIAVGFVVGLAALNTGLFGGFFPFGY